ncbi:MAG: phosphoribosylformylglycinamidine synthase subunit PurS [Candidatus Altiarchaeales archaeon]|nr:phosphoribosylformylglycinamidine synthase subunit PurS [Candidatus Altiarchaeales archaeon]
MEYKLEVKVGLKHGVLDAEGETIQKSLKLLGYDVKKVDAVKCYNITVEAKTEKEAVSRIEDSCKKLLANPVIQEYSIRVL